MRRYSKWAAAALTMSLVVMLFSGCRATDGKMRMYDGVYGNDGRNDTARSGDYADGYGSGGNAFGGNSGAYGGGSGSFGAGAGARNDVWDDDAAARSRDARRSGMTADDSATADDGITGNDRDTSLMK